MTMHTGSEPMLAHRSDVAPLLGSVQTRLLVSGRGAYAAGDLKALIALMDDTQRAHFRRGIVRQALDAAARMLPQDAFDERHAIETARCWLSDPAQYPHDAAVRVLVEARRVLAIRFPTGTRYSAYDEHAFTALRAISTISHNPLDQAAALAQSLADECAPGGESQMRQAQLDAAWSLLCGVAPTS
jgi:hypothetical protein